MRRISKIFRKFRKIPLDQQQGLIECFEENVYKNRSHIVKPNGTDKDLYYMDKGEGVIYAIIDKLIYAVHRVKQGECFNEAGALFGKPYEYGFITTSTHSTILSLPESKLIVVADLQSESNLRAQFQCKSRMFRTKVSKLERMSTGELVQHQNRFLKKYQIDYSSLKNFIKTAQTEKYKQVLRKKKIAILTSPPKKMRKKRKKLLVMPGGAGGAGVAGVAGGANGAG